MANNYGDEQVQCPFFLTQSKTEIRCMDDDDKDDLTGVVIRGRFLGFCNAGQKTNWMNDYCTGFLFSTCPTYRELEERWNQKRVAENAVRK